MALFGTGSAKFTRSGSTVLLEYSNIRPNWVVDNISTIKSVYDHYMTFENLGSYSDFWVDLNLFKYPTPADKFVEIYPTYLYSYVYFWPHADGHALSGSNSVPTIFFIKDIKHNYHTSDYVTDDILSLHFVSTDYTELDPLEDVIPGYGTETDPYEIWTAKHLDTIILQSPTGSTYSNTGSFKLMANIDCTNLTGSNSWYGFAGDFNGNNKTISNLTMTCVTGSGGLFSKATDADIYNLTLDNAHLIVSGSDTIIDDYQGILVGRYSSSPNVGIIQNVHIINSRIEGTSSAALRVGTIVGAHLFPGGYTSYIVTSSAQNCEISVTCSNSYIGGIASLWENSDIQNICIDRCFASNIRMFSSASVANWLSGIADTITTGKISSSYAYDINFNTFNVDSIAAGFIRNANTTNIYDSYAATKTGSVGTPIYFYPMCETFQPGYVTGSYYDFEFSNNTKNSGSAFVALSSSEAIGSADYADFNFSQIWSSSLNINGGRPHIQELRNKII